MSSYAAIDPAHLTIGTKVLISGFDKLNDGEEPTYDGRKGEVTAIVGPYARVKFEGEDPDIERATLYRTVNEILLLPEEFEVI